MKNDPSWATGEAVPTFEDAFGQLEGPIATVAGRAKALDWLIGWTLDRPQDEIGNRVISEGNLDALYHLANDLRVEAIALDERWRDLSADLPGWIR